MVLPLNLAMTPTEIAAAPALPAEIAWMAFHFSSDGQGLTNLPSRLPEGALLILDDSIPCKGHRTDLVVQTLSEVISQFRCNGILLDFQRPENEDSAAIAAALAASLPCPVAVTPEYAEALSCPVFLPPAPLHMPLEKYLRPWKGRAIWLEAALEQETITVTKSGTDCQSGLPSEPFPSGFFDESLCCRYHTAVSADCITFTLFDTPQTLKKKLELACSLGVTRAVGLYQELGCFLDYDISYI